MDCSTPGFPVLTVISRSLPKLTSIESVMPSSHLILCHCLLLLPSIFPSIRVFSNESALPIRWPNYWSFSFSISPSNEHPGLTSFRMDWLDLLAVQRILKRLLQHHSSKASVLQHSSFSMVQFSHPYMTTGKATALTIQTSVGRVLLLSNPPSRSVIAFLPRTNRLLISWLQSHRDNAKESGRSLSPCHGLFCSPEFVLEHCGLVPQTASGWALCRSGPDPMQQGSF